ncbi:hypothetical protein SERLA73DRAFT_52646 [Serpula lacrymans var. lacrymans S7.3]|uniref:Uncharacterized protein n=1 Tax=Serpula lacrymans var. lacrymans (strain S7.3) TaxID=936435 RepID=F8PUA3_SERL3|nr:hypothetical protein SERLA73DRAFT_52646 [Serpula lacrymans var. lacrymans S7.3]
MENEGQLRSPGTRKLRRRPSGILTTPSEASRPGAQASTGDGDEVQSPLTERFAPSVPPSVLQFPLSSHSEAPTEYDSDADSDSEDASSVPSRDSPAITSSPWSLVSHLPVFPPLYRNVLKCSIAYFLASLFTFSPYLSSFISDITSQGPGQRGPSPSGHMVATIAVYYNPAKTMGGMAEADMYCFMALLYSAFVCLGSMSMFWWLEVKPGWEWLADVLVILWVGLSMSGVAWMKVWMAKPTFNTACSMTAIILFIVIIKEGGWETLLQVAFIVFVGAVVSNVVCLLLWPQSATDNLQANMTKTLDSFSTLLEMITSSFLLEEPLHQPSYKKLQSAVENHQSSFTSLKKNLGEAHSEWFNGLSGRGSKDSRRAYEDAVDSLNRLAQHLNGLRGGTRLQYELTKAQGVGKVVLKSPRAAGKKHQSISSNGKMTDGVRPIGDDSDEALLQAAAAMFGDLVDDLGPPLKALSTACTLSLKRLRDAFADIQHARQEHVIQPNDFHEIIDGIERALFTFESTSNHAVLRLYRRSDFSAPTSRASVASNAEDNSALTNSENENVFLVYFFIFTLQEFARELASLVDAMRRIYGTEQDRMVRGTWWQRHVVHTAYINSSHRHRKVWFPKVQPHAPNTIQTPHPSNLTVIGRVERSLWELGARLKEHDLKYAFKAGMATAMLAAPAFFDSTRPVFMEYRGEWALISFFVVISPTIGATNHLSVHRVLGTLFGAGVAAGIYTAFPENAIVLSIFGFFFSLPCFYYIVAKPQYATTGRFVLLTYNLTCLYSYNLRRKDVHPLEIAFHRSVAVTAGVIWAAFVSRFWWPAEARRELSKALGEFCLNIGWLYTRLVASNSGMTDILDEPEDNSGGRSPPNEGTSLLSKPARARLSDSILEFMAMSLHLQIKLIELQGLLAQTQHEPRLKGPFPVLLYRSILTSLQTILDKLHSMRCVTTREEWWSVRREFILPVNKERHEMVGNIILFFSTLSAAFRLKAPLPPYLPPAEKSRQRLVDAIRKLDVVKNRDVKGSRQLLFFAYALTMGGVTQELDYLGRTLQTAFGVIGQTPEEFEALFAVVANSRPQVEQNV